MSDDKKKPRIILDSVQGRQDDINDQILSNAGMALNKGEDMMKSLIQHATGSASRKGKSVPRLAFAEDPQTHDNYAGIYKLKKGLLPDSLIKQIRIQNFLVAGILRARGNTVSMMGHIRRNRFDVGIDLDIKSEYKDHIEPEQMVKVQERMDRFLKILVNCGHTDGLREEEKMTLPEFLDISVRNGLSFGRFATEFIYDEDGVELHRFRPVDVGTIHPSVKRGESAEPIRRSSLRMLEELTGEKINANLFEEDEYSWVQVVNGTPRQAFTSKEMIIYNLYPSSDIEHNGFPVSPLDTIVTSVTTHQSIDVYNKLYFQNGRAAKGMLVIQSDEIDQSVIEDIKQQYNASINNVSNSFRTPIFGVGKDDKVEWQPTTSQKKDGDFQYLYDQVMRNILSAFNMSPDELPGHGHLAKGSNQQSLSESNNEYKLIAARDTGIRPLLLKMQDFLNKKIFPKIDPELAQLCDLVLAGFDAETKQQESTRLQQDMSVHYNYDQVNEEVDKERVGDHMGGSVPFNEQYRQMADMNMTAAKFESFFFNSPAAMVDPMLKFRRDQFFFQWVESMAQYNPYALQAYFATRKNNMETLKMLLMDYLDEDDMDENE